MSTHTMSISISRQSTPLPSSTLPSSSTPILPPPAYIAVIPSLLQSLSPPLSALHAARVQLLFNLPKEATRKWCCQTCGCLREGFGWKVVKVKKDPRLQGGLVGTVKRGRGVLKRSASEVDSDTACLVSSPNKKKTVILSKAPKNMLRGICSMCGTKFTLGGSDRKTIESFPPARRTRRIPSTTAHHQASLDDPNDAKASSPTISQSPSDIIQSTSRFSTSTQPSPSLLTSPRLAHIPTSHPTASTSPFPPMLPSSLPHSSTSSRSASPIGGLPKNSIPLVGPSTTAALLSSGKRKKKSGLAKLLAESKRKDEEALGGLGGLGKSWGLG
jgi:hypothetical protein